MKSTRILIADDDPQILEMINDALETDWSKCFATNGEEALKRFETEQPNLVVLDLGLPKRDGFEVCRRIRETSNTPIIILSARSALDDKIRCLRLGADDYLTKPFFTGELHERIRAILRRTNPFSTRPAGFTDGGLFIDFDKRKVTLNDREVTLTAIEFDLLRVLVLNKGKVLAHTELLEKVWSSGFGEETEYLHVHIGHLRSKIRGFPEESDRIQNVRGVGYIFQPLNSGAETH